LHIFDLENSGEGIKKENREKVFEKHYREDNSRQSSLGNSGLGLYITKQLIEAMDGTISITESEELEGIRIQIVLPVQGDKNSETG